MKLSRTIIFGCVAATCLIAAAVRAATPSTSPADALMHPIEQVVPYVAQPLPPRDVRLTGGPLKHAQDLDAAYLLQLEPDRMLARLRERAGLTPKAEGYGGWDGDGRQLTGHIVGHYLSAVSYMYEATGDARLKERVDYIVAQLGEIQTKQGDGYIGGLLGNGPQPTSRPATRPRRREDVPLLDGKVLFQKLALGEIRSGGFDLNGMWSPWYVQHKVFAGLRDAYRHTGNRQALNVELKFAAWVESIVGHLDEQQDQRMLETEFGGMNEVLVDLYADTGDRRWLNLADKFDHHAIVEPLAKGQDVLPGKHGNTQVPKLLGTLVRYLYTGDKADGDAARFFWSSVVDHHSFATGGHGYDEYFGPVDKLSGQVDGAGQRSKSLRTAETCNVYNMLKMTRRLFALHPDVQYADFEERALFNHILASIEPNTGRTCYMVPVGPGVVHEYQDMFDSFTCCVGTGMESHALHADGLYYANADQLYVSVYAPSVANWASAGAKLTMETDFPIGESATVTIELTSPKQLTLSFRRPKWAGEGFGLSVNGTPVSDLGKPDSFVDVKRTWSSGDVVSVALPKSLRTEPLPDKADRVAIMWGPLVLAGDFGSQDSDDQGENARAGRIGFPVFAEAEKPLAEWLKPVDGKPGTFAAELADGRPMTLSPFYALHDRRYGLYWDLLTPKQWSDQQAAYALRASKQQALADATVAYFQPGEMQPERDFSFKSDADTKAIRDGGQAGRRGGSWLSIESPIDPDEAVAVIVTVRATPDAKAMRLSFDDATIDDAPAVQEDQESGLSNLIFRLPLDITMDHKRGTLRLQAASGNLPAVFGIRVLRQAGAADVLK